ncbi:MAG: hypothetical protein AAGI54_01345 [Planctomycetota bacterium]
MAHGHHHHPPAIAPGDATPPGDKATPGAMVLLGFGAVAILVALAIMLISGQYEAFAFSYITAYAYVLSLGLGCLFFVLITTLFRAGWCVVLRRPVEHVAASFPILAVLAIPIVLFVVAGDGWIYPWAQPMDQLKERYYAYHYAHAAHGDDHGAGHGEHSHGDDHHDAEHGKDEPHAAADHANIVLVADAPAESHDDHAGHDHAAHADGDHAAAATYGHGEAADDPPWAPAYDLVEKKLAYLNVPFFLIRCVFYFVVWSVLGGLYWRWSVRQDASSDPELTLKREWWAPISIVLFAVTSTLAAVDIVMSLDPVFFSTMWGVYYFAGGMLGTVGMIILITMALQAFGRLTLVSREHYHDLGKLLFAFVFFWGYIAFSQYMLIWYGNIPEETMWFEHHGWTTVPGHVNGWSYVGLFILAGHFVIPFAFLLSRWVKRNALLLMIAAVWLMFMHYVDVWWIVMPMLHNATPLGNPVAVAMQVCLPLGMLALLLGAALLKARQSAWVPLGDPRLPESARFENY